MKKIISILLVILCLGFIGSGGNTEKHEGQVSAPSNAIDLQGRNFEDITTEVEKQGFTNIVYEVIENLNDEYQDGEVVSVLIDGESTYSSDSWYLKEVPVVITYAADSEKKTAVSEPEPVVQQVNGYEVGNYEQIKKEGRFQRDIYLKGTLIDVFEYDDLTFQDEDGHLWYLPLETHYDFNDYINTECEIYGTVVKLLPVKETMQMSLTDSDHRVIFYDGNVKGYGRQNDSTFKSAPEKIADTEVSTEISTPITEKNVLQESETETKENLTPAPEPITEPIVSTPEPVQEEKVEVMVWTPIHGGTKYHSNPNCSNMKDPVQVTIDTAKANGYSACKKCYR